MILNPAGQIAWDYLHGLPEKYKQTQLHEHIVIPNHIHVIIEIKNVPAIHESPDLCNAQTVGAIHESPRQNNETNIDMIYESPVKSMDPDWERVVKESFIQSNNNDTETVIRESPIQELSLCDQRRKMLLSKMIGWYKMNTAKYIHLANGTPGRSFWQRNYYDHIIRDYDSYLNISEYIISNPLHWNTDRFYKEPQNWSF